MFQVHLPVYLPCYDLPHLFVCHGFINRIGVEDLRRVTGGVCVP